MKGTGTVTKPTALGEPAQWASNMGFLLKGLAWACAGQRTCDKPSWCPAQCCANGDTQCRDLSRLWERPRTRVRINWRPTSSTLRLGSSHI
jgi:hypothetical protein